MKRVSIVGLGWLGMPLAQALLHANYHVCGTKRTKDGMMAASHCGINTCQLHLTPDLICDTADLQELLDTDALIITLPASRSADNSASYIQAVQNLVNSARAAGVVRIIFTSSTSVYGSNSGEMTEQSLLQPDTVAGHSLVRLEQWLHDLPGTAVDILRLAGLAGPGRHPGRFLAGKKGLTCGAHGVNLVHLDDVIAAIILLLNTPSQGRTFNLCAEQHPRRDKYYPEVARLLGLTEPEFVQSEQSDGKIINGQAICNTLGFKYQFSDPYKMTVK